jgi:hypothetical protein
VIIGGSGKLLSIINVNKTNVSNKSNNISNITRINDRSDSKHNNINNNDSISKFESDNKLKINDALTLSRSNNTLPNTKQTQPESTNVSNHKLTNIKVQDTQRIRFDGEEQRGGFIETLMNTFGINTCPQIPPDLGRCF